MTDIEFDLIDVRVQEKVNYAGLKQRIFTFDITNIDFTDDEFADVDEVIVNIKTKVYQINPNYLPDRVSKNVTQSELLNALK